MYNEMEYQEEYRMADLIRRQWLGIITAEEQAELEAWSLQEEHARLYAKIRNQAELQKRNLYVDGLDVDGVWHKLREQIADVPVRKRRFFTCYRVVACLLLLIGVGTLLVYNRYSRLQPSDLLVQSIHPGSSKAVLITNEGKQIILQDSLNQEIQVDESVTVKNTGLLAEYCLQDLQAAEQAEIKYNTIVVPRGGEYEVRLPDGSVFLRASPGTGSLGFLYVPGLCFRFFHKRNHGCPPICRNPHCPQQAFYPALHHLHSVEPGLYRKTTETQLSGFFCFSHRTGKP